MPNKTYDVLIVGGSAMGSSIAYYLRKTEPNLSVCVVEKDPGYERSGTVLSDGNMRLQFNLKENIQMSMYGMEMLKTFSEDMATEHYTPEPRFRQEGNLFIVSEDVKPAALEGLKTQQDLGCDVVWLEPDQVKEKFPYYDLKDCAGATFGARDGTMSPIDILLGYRRKAIDLGAEYLETSVKRVLKDGKDVTGIELENGEQLLAPVVINCAGTWASELAKTVDIDLPVRSTKREVYFINSYIEHEGILPAIFFPTGNYLMHEAQGNFTTGGGFPDDPETLEDFSWSKERFEERFWETIAGYIPKLEQLKVSNGWAGHYAINTLDGNGIIGEFPELDGFYVTAGFSGHGFQQCHAIGRYISELILEKTPTLDLSILSPRRILENKPVFENKQRLI